MATPIASSSPTKRGHVVDGDQLLAVIAQSWKEDGASPSRPSLSTVMSNLGLERFLEGQGIELLRTAVGDRYVLEQMMARGYNLGGEPSGHIILSDYATHRRRLCSSPPGCSRWCRRHGRRSRRSVIASSRLPQVLKNVRYRAGKPLDDIEVKSAISAGEKRLNGQGRLLVRSSGTESVDPRHGRGRRPYPGRGRSSTPSFPRLATPAAA